MNQSHITTLPYYSTSLTQPFTEPSPNTDSLMGLAHERLILSYSHPLCSAKHTKTIEPPPTHSSITIITYNPTTTPLHKTHLPLPSFRPEKQTHSDTNHHQPHTHSLPPNAYSSCTFMFMFMQMHMLEGGYIQIATRGIHITSNMRYHIQTKCMDARVVHHHTLPCLKTPDSWLRYRKHLLLAKSTDLKAPPNAKVGKALRQPTSIRNSNTLDARG